MKIGVLRMSVKGSVEPGFYNIQYIGFSKALSKVYEEVIVYRNTYKSNRAQTQRIEGYDNLVIHVIPVFNIGVNGLVNLDVLDRDLDVLILFSDIQISVPKVYHWAKRNNILLLPYIGVIESHSTNIIKRLLMNISVKNTLRIYRKCHCLVKTPFIKNELIKNDVKRITVIPAGLDTDLLNHNHMNVKVDELRKKYGFSNKERIILYIGRLEPEKQPMQMLEIFRELLKIDNKYRLIMVGKGELKENILSNAESMNVMNNILFMDEIPNKEIWELYKISEAYVNLNRQEIFGMAILEAMYYGCKVVAWHAPGPDFIIEDKISGYLVNDIKDVLDAIMNETDMSKSAHHRIVSNFTWDIIAQETKKIIMKE